MRYRRFDIGKMRQRISIYTTTRADDGSGGFSRLDPSEATKLKDCWSYIRPLTERERTWGEQFAEDVTHECWLRRDDAIRHGMTIRHGTVDYYVVTAVPMEGMDEFMRLTLRQGGPM